MDCYEIKTQSNKNIKYLKNKFYSLVEDLRNNHELVNKMNFNDNYLSNFFQYLINQPQKFKDVLLIISRAKNMHIRYLFMKELITKNIELVNTIYGDICRYFIDYTYKKDEQLTFLPNYMDIKEICDIALLYLKNNNLWEFRRIKHYILTNYKKNMLGYMLHKKEIYKYGESKEKIAEKDKINRIKERELLYDLDNLFETSSTYKIHLYQDYHKLLSQNILEDFEERIKYFKSDEALSSNKIARGIADENVKRLFKNSMGLGINVSNIYEHELGDTLESYVDKYLALSERCDYEFIGEGSTCAVYRIGDYVFKLVRMKWSHEDVICPDLFLILKNLEEIYLRDEKGVVVSGIEVQKYLSRKVTTKETKYLNPFLQEISKLGYRVDDLLINSVYGDNVAILDSYLDADTKTPEELPEWFKECPIVLIDRDRVYKKNKRLIRQLGPGVAFHIDNK